MPGLLRRPVRMLVLIALAFGLIARGIVPAMSKIESDFPNYFTAARLVAERADLRRLYDDAWFQQQQRRYDPGTRMLGKFSPFPPPTALLLLPLAHLQPLTALRWVTVLSLICLMVSIVALSRVLAWRLVDAALLVLLSGYAIATGLRLGQPYIVVSMLCILGYLAYLRRRPLLAGACFGLFAPIKYYPVIMLCYFAVRRQWRIAAAGAIAILLVLGSSIALLGWDLHRQFLTSVLERHLSAQLSLQDPYSVSFQSFDSLFRRLLVFDPTLNPKPALAGTWAAAQLVTLCTKAAILLATLASLLRAARRASDAGPASAIGLLGIAALLLAPASAGYHYVLLWLPVGLLVDHLLRTRRALCAYLIMACYASIGFLPYKFSNPFAGDGILTLLAFPRLWLLLAMLLIAMIAIWRVPQQARQPSAHDSPLPAS